jgi:predicted MFS family arabinose efflux permease
VSGGALTVSLIPAKRRGEGLALVGVVSGIPSVAALPLGVWFASHVGFQPVFLAAALAALIPLASLPGLPGGGSGAGVARDRRSDGMMAGLRTPAVVRPAIIFAATTMAAGIFVTFLPLAATHATANVAALALLCQPAASIGGRWLAGRYGDRHGTARRGTAGRGLLVPGVLITAAGVAALSLSSVPAAVLAGATLFGVGFGITQNTTLTQMYDRVPESGYSMVSAVWNLAYDAGMGIGAAGFGLLAAHTGYPAGFALTAVVVLLPLAGGVGGRSPLTRGGAQISGN